MEHVLIQEWSWFAHCQSNYLVSAFLVICAKLHPDKPTAKAKQNILEAGFTPRLTVEQQITPQDLVSRIVSF